MKYSITTNAWTLCQLESVLMKNRKATKDPGQQHTTSRRIINRSWYFFQKGDCRQPSNMIIWKMKKEKGRSQRASTEERETSKRDGAELEEARQTRRIVTPDSCRSPRPVCPNLHSQKRNLSHRPEGEGKGTTKLVSIMTFRVDGNTGFDMSQITLTLRITLSMWQSQSVPRQRWNATWGSVLHQLTQSSASVCRN